MNHVGYVWTILRKIFPGEITLQIKGMRQFANSEGCAFDVPEDISNHFEEVIKKDKFYGANFTIERTISLPECTDGGKMQYVGNNSSTNGGHFTRYNGASNGTRGGKERKDIFIGNMPFKVDVEDVKDFLKSHKVDPESDIDIRIAIDKDTGKQKGFMHISCYDTSKYSQILKLNGTKFQERVLKVDGANAGKTK